MNAVQFVCEVTRRLFHRKMSNIPEHIKTQHRQGPPFYCGTAFCGHSTMKAAAECREQKCARRKEVQAKFYAIEATGDLEGAIAFMQEANRDLYPEMDPNNWPINRSSASMQAQYIERAKKESERD